MGRGGTETSPVLKQLLRKLRTTDCVHAVPLDEPCRTCDDWWVGGEESPSELPAGWVATHGQPRAIL